MVSPKGGIVLAAAVALLLAACGGKEEEAGEALGEDAASDLAAIVNGQEIRRAEVDRVVAQWRKSPNPPVDVSLPITELRKEAMGQLVDRTLLVQEARRRGYRADSAQVENQLRAFVARFPSEEALLATLKPLNLTTDQLKDMYDMDLCIQSYVAGEVSGLVKVTDKSCQDYYDGNPQLFGVPEKVRARHILFTLDAAAPAQAEEETRAKAQAVLERARKGEDFAALAVQFSQDPVSKEGDLGFFGRGAMVAPFDEAVFALEPGQISDLVRTQFGLHIIKLEERQAGGTLNYEEVAPQIRSMLTDQGIRDRLDDVVQELRSSAQIETRL